MMYSMVNTAVKMISTTVTVSSRVWFKDSLGKRTVSERMLMRLTKMSATRQNLTKVCTKATGKKVDSITTLLHAHGDEGGYHGASRCTTMKDEEVQLGTVLD